MEFTSKLAGKKNQQTPLMIDNKNTLDLEGIVNGNQENLQAQGEPKYIYQEYKNKELLERAQERTSKT